jgi:hypothetical protein
MVNRYDFFNIPMKHTTFVMQKYLLTFLLFSLITGRLTAQRLVSDAKIVYRTEATGQADPNLEGGVLTQYVKGNQSRVDFDFKTVHYSYLIDTKNQTVVTLVDNNGDKYLIRAGKEDYEKELKQYASVQFTDTKETKEIAGYTCKRAIGKMPDGKTFDVYYSMDLIPENKQFNRRFVNLKGIPLQFEILNKNGTKTTMIATKVDLFAVPGSYFDVPKSGYKEISREEMSKIGN